MDIPVVFNRILDIEAMVGRMSNAAFQHELVKDDTGPKLRFHLMDSAGTAMNISGQEVMFYLKRTGEASHVNVGHEACSGFDMANGIVDYSFVSGDLGNVGTYWGDVQIHYEDGSRETGFESVRFLVRDNNK